MYDATEVRAYWLHVQGHFAAQTNFNLFRAGQTVTVHLDAKQILGPSTIRLFAALRDEAEQRTDAE